MSLRTLFIAVAALGVGLPASARQLTVNPPLAADRAQAIQNWLQAPPPGQWCMTQQSYLANLAARGINPVEAACAESGPCDLPLDRDAAIPTAATPIKTVRLSVHVFRENSGANAAATQADVDAAVARLNAHYAPWRIQFTYETDFINSTKHRYLLRSETWGMKNAHANSTATKLNVYVVDTGDGACWGTFPWDPNALGAQGGIVMHYYWFVATTPLASILTHEVGHCLGLWHTHHGTSEVPECSDCYEPAGRPPEQGDVTGDRCSDTNPSPTNVNNCFDPAGLDPCSNTPWLLTPYLNYMSYSHTCPIEFTTQQAGRMHCWTADVLTGWLELPAPPTAPGAPSLSKLSDGQVRIAWTDNSGNEDGFRVQRETKSGGSWINPQLLPTVAANTTLTTDTPGSGTFRYRVQAFNANGDSAWSAWTQIRN